MSDLDRAIAIVGVSALFPGSSDVCGFWRDILAGADRISDVPASHWRIEDYYDPNPAAPDKTYGKRGGFLSPVPFDALAFGIPPATLPATDTSQLLALITAQQVLQDAAGGQFESMDRSRISVILGVTSAQELLFSMVSRLQRPVWERALREAGLAESKVQEACARIAGQYVPWQESSFPGLLGNVVAGRIANRLNLGGTNCVTDAACASSLSALSMAVQELQLGHSDLAIAGGVDTLNDIFMYMCFSKTPALSPTGDCRPFSDQADGTMLGEGLGMVALKRLADAERDSDAIYAVLRGLGTASDGRSKSVYAPVSEGQALALRRTYAMAGYAPETVQLMEAHGTGTKAGDVAEFDGLRMVFAGEGGPLRPWCALGSVKSQIGHTKAAAGAAGLIKIILALQHKILPPTIKVAQPNPKLQLAESPFYLNTRARPWLANARHPRRASVSAFGFGGSNFHATLEEYNGRHTAARFPVQTVDLLLLHAESVPQLVRECQQLREQKESLTRLAAESRSRWSATAQHRLALVVRDEVELRRALSLAIERLQGSPGTGFELVLDAVIGDSTGATTRSGSGRGLVRYGSGGQSGTLAYLFPGQGSQYLNMGADVAMHLECARQVWDRAVILPELAASASAKDSGATGEPGLAERVFPPPAFDAATQNEQQAALTATEWAQPALAAHSLALLAVLDGLGIKPDSLAGHSFGELLALHAAGHCNLDACLRLARARGLAMRDAAQSSAGGEPGAMLAVSAGLDTLEPLLAKHPTVVLANHNGPKQCVVSGPGPAIDAFAKALASQSAPPAHVRLPVSSAFHSPQVAAASQSFAQALAREDFDPRTGAAKVYGNSTAAPYPGTAVNETAEARPLRDRYIEQLAGQLARPVHFVAMIEAMYADGVRTFVEVGPGTVLSGLLGQILGVRPHLAISLDHKQQDGLQSLLHGLARLAAAGVSMTPEQLFAGQRLPAPTRSPPAHAIAICGSNVGKPYPPSDGQWPAPNPEPPHRPQRQPELAVASPASSGPLEARESPSAGANPALAVVPSLLHPRPSPQPETSSVSVPEPHPFKAGPQLAPSATSVNASSTSPAQVPGAWWSTFQETQAATAAAHEAYQRAMAETHLAYLKLAEQTMRSLAGLAGLADPSRAESAPLEHSLRPPGLSDIGATPKGVPTPMPNDGVARLEPAPARAVVLPPPSAQVAVPPSHPVQRQAASVAAASPSIAATVAAAEQPATHATHVHPAPRSAELLLTVVAEKTGYPREMLNLDMDLESDLGVDSIKRVEILSALEEHLPSLARIDRGQLSALRSLREIEAACAGAADTLAACQADATTPPVASIPALVPVIDVSAALLTVVAEKTGYPREMLDLDMDLEGDLGVDSIKRVEILSALEEQLPALAKADRGQLSALRSLREIEMACRSSGGETLATQAAKASPKDADKLAAQTSSWASTPASNLPATPASAAVPAAGSAATREASDVRALLLDVVAEKTGYPKEMLDVTMDLEADLGIDSIKRVEILSAVEERLPGRQAQGAQRQAMSTMRTLAEVLGAFTANAVTEPEPSDAVASRAPSQRKDAAATTASPEPLPTPAPSATGADPLAAAACGRYVVAPIAAPCTGLAMPDLHAAEPLWVLGHEQIGPMLAARLAERGIQARYSTALPETARRCIYLGGLRHATGADAAIAVNAEAFTLARQLAVNLEQGGGMFVCAFASMAAEPSSEQTSGDKAAAASHVAWSAGLPALLKTCALEWPQAAVKAIALDLCFDALATDEAESARLCDWIVQELLAGGGEIEVQWTRAGERLSLACTRLELDPAHAANVIADGDVVVVSGGARGVTSACLLAWVADCRPRLILLGRSRLEPEPDSWRDAGDEASLNRVLLAESRLRGEALTPGALAQRVHQVLAAREVRATLAALAARGVDAHYYSVAVEDPRTLADCLAGVRAQFGPIRGVIHAAGVLADKRISAKTDAQFAHVFDTKVRGLAALLSATADDPLRLLCVFSSVSARCGNTGQADYAMANAVLGSVARQQSVLRPGLRVKVLGWGPWQGGMVNPALKQRFAALGVPMLGLAQGAAMFAAEMSSAEGVELVLGGEPRPQALLSSGAEVRLERLEVSLDPTLVQWLDGHQVAGQPVVPLVLVAEWFTRALHSLRPGYHVVALHDLTVLKGIRLQRSEKPGELSDARLIIEARPLPATAEQGAHAWQLNLRHPNGELHYSARAELADQPPRASHGLPTLELDAWNGAQPYEELLFHRDRFQLIEQMLGISDHGVAAKLRGLAQADWPEQAWQSDVAALDGGMQLAVLYGQRMMGGPNLPTGVAELRTYPGRRSEGPIHGAAYRRRVGSMATTTDILLTDARGRRIAELFGVRNHALTP